MTLSPLLTIVIPVYNEELTVSPVFLSLLENLSQSLSLDQFEFIFINDGSVDSSALLLEDLLVRYSSVNIILFHLERRTGIGNALKLGTGKAQGLHVCWIDADGTYHASDVLRLYNAIGSAHQIIGARKIDHGNFPAARYAIKRLTATIAGWFWKQTIPDLNSGLRIFTRQSFQSWMHLMPSGFSCSTTATLAALSAKQRILFLPIQYSPRPAHSLSKFRTFYDSLLLCRQILYLYFH